MRTILPLLSLLVGLSADAATVTVAWNPSPSSQVGWGGTTNQAEADMTYYVYQSGQVDTNYVCIGSTTTTNWTMIMVPMEAYFYVIASNFWGISPQSNICRVPAPVTPISGTNIKRQ